MDDIHDDSEDEEEGDDWDEDEEEEEDGVVSDCDSLEGLSHPSQLALMEDDDVASGLVDAAPEAVDTDVGDEDDEEAVELRAEEPPVVREEKRLDTEDDAECTAPLASPRPLLL